MVVFLKIAKDFSHVEEESSPQLVFQNSSWAQSLLNTQWQSLKWPMKSYKILTLASLYLSPKIMCTVLYTSFFTSSVLCLTFSILFSSFNTFFTFIHREPVLHTSIQHLKISTSYEHVVIILKGIIEHGAYVLSPSQLVVCEILYLPLQYHRLRILYKNFCLDKLQVLL